MGWIDSNVFGQLFSTNKDNTFKEQDNYLYSVWWWVTIWDMEKIQKVVTEMPTLKLTNVVIDTNLLQ